MWLSPANREAFWRRLNKDRLAPSHSLMSVPVRKGGRPNHHAGSADGTAFEMRTMQLQTEAFRCDSACDVLRRRNVSAELHRLSRNFLAASPQSNRDKRSGKNDGALHSLDLLCCPPAPPDIMERPSGQQEHPHRASTAESGLLCDMHPAP